MEGHESLSFIFQEDGLISSVKNNYVPREDQIKAAHLLFDCFSDKKHAIIEGPCGFGKTFAYLVPLFQYIFDKSVKNKEPINKLGCVCLIVTSGITLQEQLFNQDLPFVSSLFEQMFKQKVSFATVKGRGNFLCKRKFSESQMSMCRVAGFENVKSWAPKTKTGDIEELGFVLEQDLRSEIICSEGECKGTKCLFYKDCYYQKQKVKAFNSSVVITNYHMLFSDMNTGGKILPQSEIRILDEAHEAPNIMRDFLEKSYSVFGMKVTRGKLQDIVKECTVTSSLFDLAREDIIKPKESVYDFYYVLQEVIDAFSDFLDRSQQKFLPDFVRGNTSIVSGVGEVPDFSSLKSAVERFESRIQNTYGKLSDFSEMEESKDTNVQEAFFYLNSILNDNRSLIESLEKAQNQTQEDINVYYYEKTNRGAIKFCIKPSEVSEQMDQFLFEDISKTCVMTSATLSTSGNFNFIKKETGADKCESREILEFIGNSPFDLKNQQLWYLPKNAVPGNSPDFEKTISINVPEIIEATRGGILFLSTSVKNMNLIYDCASMFLMKTRYPIMLLKQGQLPRNMLIDQFREDQNSILVATKSMFTGIDIPGDSLRCVVIDKIPFPQANDPVMLKLRQRYGGKCFIMFDLPNAIITLKQAVGRGVRSVGDKCGIVLLDSRMSAKQSNFAGKIGKSFDYERTATRDYESFCEFYR